MKYLRVLVLAAITLAAGSVSAQYDLLEPDARLWSGGATNPNGESAVPMLQYLSTTGHIYLSTLGLNGSLDTDSRMSIGGDDVGMISISIEMPPAITNPRFSGYQDGVIKDGVIWANQHFNGKQQIFGISAGALFSEPGVYWLFRTAPELDLFADFGVAEMAVNFENGLPGATIFGGIQMRGGPYYNNQGYFLPAEVDGVGQIDCSDADLLSHMIVTQDYGLGDFDYDASGQLDEDDFDLWMWKASFAYYDEDPFGPLVHRPFLRGDVNFDHVVDLEDFNVWNANKFTESDAYCSGDFNLDGFVDVSDFNVWNENRFRSSQEVDPPVFNVPEPSAATHLLMLLLGFPVFFLPDRRRCAP